VVKEGKIGRKDMQKLKAIGAAVLAGLVGCGIMLMLPGVGESTAAAVGAAAAVAGWQTVMHNGKP
jgi:transposase